MTDTTAPVFVEPMAMLRWKFAHPLNGVLIQGGSEKRTVKQAQQIATALCEEFGDGSHWVEPMNCTYAERYPPVGEK